MTDDFLEEIIAERTTRNPHFPKLMEAAARRRELMRALVTAREASGLSRDAVAARMSTTPAVVARIESGNLDDTKLSVLERYAAAVGRQIEWRVTSTSS